MMKRTLLICGTYPLPEHIGSNIRTMHLVRFFRKYGPVDIAYDRVMSGESPGSSMFQNEYRLHIRSGISQKPRFRCFSIKRRPFEISRYCKDSERLLLSLIKSHHYSYICVRYIYPTWSLLKLPPAYKERIIVDVDDIVSGSLSELQIAAVKSPLKRWVCRLNRRFLMDYEKRCLGFGAVLFCSEQDRKRFVESNSTTAFVVPNVYESGSFETYDFGDGFQKENILLFVGLLNYLPNIMGLKWFIESIFPLFVQTYPGSQFLIVGRDPTDALISLCERSPNVQLLANVSDIREYYKRCRAVVVPLQAGGGSRIKILEAALANRPILSTAIGAEGLELHANTDFLGFDDARSFTDQYKKLLVRHTYDTLIRSASEKVLGCYSAERLHHIMEHVVHRIETADYHHAAPTH